ncbi:MAG: hypothetical protein H7321_09200 [Bacteroidia bacterium]|nr:hypothetical protein [Bacteroidia bacterium]
MPQAARGFIYPFRLHGKNSNNPTNYKVSWTGKWDGCRIVSRDCYAAYGLAGLESTTYDTAGTMTVTMTPDAKIEYLFDRVKVFYDVNYQSMQIGIDSLTEVKEVIENRQQGYTEFIFMKPLTQVTFTINKRDSIQNHFTLYGFYFDLDAPGINYSAIGVNGASVPSFLKTSGNFERQLSVIKPDLIIFSIGINDAFDPNFTQSWYEGNYSEMIKRIKKVAPGAAILFTTNTDSYKKRKNKYYKNVTGIEVKGSMQNLANKYGAGVWDLFSVMGGLGSMQFWINNHMAANDHIHFSRKGYYLMGDLMFTAIIKKYEQYLKMPVAKLKHE